MSFAAITAAATGATLALASSAHCAVMCGPLALAARVRGGASASASYLGGRLVGYTAAGALAGAAGHALLASPLARHAELLLSALLVALLLAAAREHLRSATTERPVLVQLGTAPTTSRMARLLVRVADEPLLLGVASALLPCGVLFLALAAAAKLATPWLGAVVLGSFATVSAAVLLTASMLGARVLRAVAARRLLGVVLVAAAGLTVYRALPLLSPGGAPTCPLHARTEVR